MIEKMGVKQPRKPKHTVNFRCVPCRRSFAAAPLRVEDAPELPWHPFRYFHRCETCGGEVEQAAWERALFKAWTKATGPRTPEGKARSAANIEGHPTPDEALITRFNRMKHGLFAKTAKFFPARPGRYPQCDGCEHLSDFDRKESECVRHHACLKQVQLFMRYDAAFAAKDPSLLVEMQAQRHAAIQTIIDQMILTIAQDGGPRMKTVDWYYDKDGTFHLAKWTDEDGVEHQIYKHEEHVLLKRLIEYVSKNSMTLADMGMTPKVQEDQNMMKGFLDSESSSREEANEYRRRIEEQQQKLLELVENSYSDAEAIDITDQAEIVRDG